jgi:hypothetical protein
MFTMARFYGSMENSHGNTVTANNADNAHLRGWNAGVKVTRKVVDGRDLFVVIMTGGSNGNTLDHVIGEVTDTPDGPRFAPFNS